MTPDDDRLVSELHALREDVGWPATPDLAATVAGQTPSRDGQVATSPPRRLWARMLRKGNAATGSDPWGRGRLVLATALLVALGIGVVPPARSAVADLLGLGGGEQVRRVPALPPAPRRAQPDQAPGTTTTLAAARAHVRFAVRVPRALGAPDRVKLWDGLPGGAVILTYGDHAALWAFEGSSARYVRKLVTPDTTVRRVRVGRAPGFWLQGAPTGFVAVGRDGIPMQATAAIVDANVLVWHAHGVAYRLETRDGLRRALAVARSLAS